MELVLYGRSQITCFVSHASFFPFYLGETFEICRDIMQPLRVSSEAPEVVPGQPENYVYINYEEGRYKRTSSEEASEASYYLKPYDARERDGKKLVPTPQIIYDQISYQEKPVRRRRTFGLLNTIVFALVAFLIGGGIGGGVGGALATKAMSRHQPNATASAASATSTTVVDTAGCPMVNNSTYTSTSSGTKFLKLCATDIVAASGQYIEKSNSVQTSFNACLDSCASTKGCVGASWVIFSPTIPSRNSVCFLKNATGVATAASVSGQTVVSGFLGSTIGL